MYINSEAQQMPARIAINGRHASRDWHIAHWTHVELAAAGWRRAVVEPGCAPFGYEAPVAEEIDGELVFTVALSGTSEERVAECLRLHRERLEAKREQCLRALDQAGFGAAMLAWRNDPARTLTEIAWYEESIWQRLDYHIVSMGPDFGLTPEQIDELFALAKTL